MVAMRAMWVAWGLYGGDERKEVEISGFGRLDDDDEYGI